MTRELRDARVRIGVPGFSGDITGSATLTDHETRIATIEAAGIPAELADLSDVGDLSGATTGDLWQYDGADWVPYTPEAITLTTGLSVVIGVSGTAITTGVKGDIELPFAGTLTRVRIFADQTGDLTVQGWKDTYANYPPTSGDQIFELAMSSDTTAESSVLSVAVSAGDVLRLNISSAATVERATVALTFSRDVGP